MGSKDKSGFWKLTMNKETKNEVLFDVVMTIFFVTNDKESFMII